MEGSRYVRMAKKNSLHYKARPILNFSKVEAIVDYYLDSIAVAGEGEKEESVANLFDEDLLRELVKRNGNFTENALKKSKKVRKKVVEAPNGNSCILKHLFDQLLKRGTKVVLVAVEPIAPAQQKGFNEMKHC